MVAFAQPARAAPAERAIAWWLLCCCALIFLMVVIGGITRLTESGLSITEWKPIEGVLPPLNEAQWEDAFARYQAIPQYHAIHADMSLADFKSIYFWEYLHRLLGRLIGAAFAVPFLYFLLRGRVSRVLAPKLAGLFILGGLQGALGWYMVESGLESRIEVSQYRLAAHLAMAVVIYLAMLWVALDLLRSRESSPSPPLGAERAGVRWGLEPHPPHPRDAEHATGMFGPSVRWTLGRRHAFSALKGGEGLVAHTRLRYAATAVLILVFTTLVAGAFVAGTRAGYLDNTFPLMEGRFMPPDYWHLSPWYLNWFENLTSVQFDHRVLAETSWCAIALLWLAGLRAQLAPAARWSLHVLFFFACLQVALGISTLLLVVPLPLAVAHQAGALGLLTAALVARHVLRRG
jgi:cytochrome c oxidase assembly protein subunit 15